MSDTTTGAGRCAGPPPGAELGRSLDDPDVRMELWLALKATASPSAGD
ncbi:hypothetical protein [Streptomyces sp. NPDC002690]